MIQFCAGSLLGKWKSQLQTLTAFLRDETCWELCPIVYVIPITTILDSISGGSVVTFKAANQDHKG